MYAVSDLFKQYIAQSDREFEIKAIVGAVTYDDSSVIEFDIEDSIIPSEDLTLGVAITSRLTISIRTQNSIPTNAKITPMTRLHGVSGSTEWVPLGSYYVDSRNFQNDVWKFTCYDKLILAQQLYVSSLVYPVSMQSVWNELVGQLGYTVDSSVVINPAYMIPYKDEDISMRDMMGYIASAHGASLRMTKDETIAFVKPRSGATQTSILASDYFKVDQINPLKTYTQILLTYNSDGETLTSGSGDDDHTLKLFNPFMNQTMLNNILSEINGFNYTPFTMDWKGRPDLEVGDAVTVTLRDNTTFPSLILCNKMSFKGGLKAVSTAPSYAAQRSEFDFKGSLSKQISGAVQIEKPYYGVTIGRANGIKVEKSDGSGKLILNSDVIEMDDSSGSPIFKLSSAGKLLISAVVQMLEGSTIDWNSVSSPTADQVGAKDINWNPEIPDIAGLAEKMTHIDQNGIYTGTLTAQQINALLINGVTITALEELAIRGFADAELGRNPRLVWQCADSDGESSITDIPTNPGSGNSEADTLFIIVNSNDPDGEWEVYRGGVYLGGRSKLGVSGLVDLIVHGTIQVGNGAGLANAPWGVNIDGDMSWADKGPVDGWPGGRCSINTYGGAFRAGAGENYIRINPPMVGGSILDIVALNAEGISETVMSLGVSTGLTVNGQPVGGGVGSTLPAVAMAVDFHSDDTGVTISRDGALENWTWTKDEFGKITSMTSDRGRTINVEY